MGLWLRGWRLFALGATRATRRSWLGHAHEHSWHIAYGRPPRQRGWARPSLRVGQPGSRVGPWRRGAPGCSKCRATRWPPVQRPSLLSGCSTLPVNVRPTVLGLLDAALARVGYDDGVCLDVAAVGATALVNPAAAHLMTLTPPYIGPTHPDATCRDLFGLGADRLRKLVPPHGGVYLNCPWVHLLAFAEFACSRVVLEARIPVVFVLPAMQSGSQGSRSGKRDAAVRHLFGCYKELVDVTLLTGMPAIAWHALSRGTSGEFCISATPTNRVWPTDWLLLTPAAGVTGELDARVQLAGVGGGTRPRRGGGGGGGGRPGTGPGTRVTMKARLGQEQGVCFCEGGVSVHDFFAIVCVSRAACG
eukprot:TRINITY_DN2000_c0_g1_i1.p1 TRINITY_DN2000_c0_g1~~TRINITY_DN2000_c0_g1_i1.p1  ORF type:complete len:361 (+),score=19.48 TRINITY_DN2000_c0_g1_i1:621-1703(+)